MKTKINLEHAKSIATAFINPRGGKDDLTANAILDEQTIERWYGWLFFYQSRKYVQTRDDRYLTVPGTSLPVVVYKSNGNVRDVLTLEYLLDYLLRLVEFLVFSLPVKLVKKLFTQRRG